MIHNQTQNPTNQQPRQANSTRPALISSSPPVARTNTQSHLKDQQRKIKSNTHRCILIVGSAAPSAARPAGSGANNPVSILATRFRVV
jgi:hypothetical protein